MAELLNCPFCGGKAERVDIEDGDNAGGSFIHCTVCDASGNVEFEFKENFVSNWNRRSTAPSGQAPLAEVTIRQLQDAHIERQEEWCPEQKPDLSFRGNEMAGEVGEACNVIKKLERERHGWRGSRATKEQLADELADVVHTAVLCAITAGIDLGPAVVRKFNATSEKNGLATRLTAPHTFTANGPGVLGSDNCQICERFNNEPETEVCRDAGGGE